MTNSILGERAPVLAGDGWPTLPPRTPTGECYSYAHPPRTLAELERLGLPELIAHVPRWGGLGPSVLRHTILFVRLAELLAGEHEERRRLAARYAGAHDLAEGVLLDLPRPLKALLPDYQALERAWSRGIHEVLGLPWDPPAALGPLLNLAHEEATALEMWMIDHLDTGPVFDRLGWTVPPPPDHAALALTVLEGHSDERLIAELRMRLGLAPLIACCRVCCCIDAEACTTGAAGLMSPRRTPTARSARPAGRAHETAFDGFAILRFRAEFAVP